MFLTNTLRKLVLVSGSIQNQEAEESDVAAAMYWRAYALYKAGHRGDAARQINQLEREHAASRWLNEARALQIEHQGSIDDASEEDELRLFALSHLLERDFNRALPLVLEILNNTHSNSVRQDALFVLGMSDHPDAQKAIADAVSNSDDPDLQAQNASRDVKQAVMHAYFNAEMVDELQGLLKIETDPGLLRDIIHALGALEATDEIKKVYADLTNVETRRAAIEAFAISGNTSMLKDILATETDPEIRRTAIQGIAINDDGESAELIRSLYDESSDIEEKRMLMESLLIMDDAEGLATEIIETELDPELLELAIHALTMVGSTEKVLEAMAIVGDQEGVRRVLETEKDTELKVAAVHALAISGDESTAEILVAYYAGSTRPARTAIIESMMMLDDARGLISLLKLEDDPELRKQMMEVLSVMDSEEANDYMFELLESKS
jgi:HEAT repeat protein